MCLSIDYLYHDAHNAMAIKAQQDILCYKVVLITNSRLYSPFQYSQIKLTKRKKFFKPDRFKKKVSTFRYIRYGIHVYNDFSIAKQYAYRLSQLRGSNTNVYKVIPVKIPKNTYYWMGLWCEMCAECVQFPDNWKDYLK